jgi:hypothetical protein
MDDFKDGTLVKVQVKNKELVIFLWSTAKYMP